MSNRINRKNYSFFLLVALASVVLFIKLMLSYKVYGTNDVSYWIAFSKIIQKFGTFRIYSLMPIYNHPPLISWLIKTIALVELKTKLGFPFLFRLIPILSDYASFFVIWALLGKYKIKNKALICLACIINPISFLVSGFHGNTDSLFILIILLAIYSAENNNFILSGLFYGLSICVKITPVILIPIFFFYLSDKRERAIFFLSSLILPILVFLPYLFKDSYSVLRNIFLYTSLKGIWGLGHILVSVFTNKNVSIYIRDFAFLLFKFHVAYGIIIFFIIEVFLSRYLMRDKRTNLIEAVFFAFCLFLAITPGFGVQYLSWLALYAVMASFKLGLIYMLAAGFFLYRVYAYWSGGLPLYYADSDRVGQWIGFERFLGIVVWLIIIIMLTEFLLSKRNLLVSEQKVK